MSGELSFEAHSKEELENWKKKGYIIKESTTRPGLMKKLKWSHMEDRLKYNLLNNVNKLIVPFLMIVGENDESTPVKHQKVLFNVLPGQKELHIIKDAPHTFIDKKHLQEIKKIILKWIEKI